MEDEKRGNGSQIQQRRHAEDHWSSGGREPRRSMKTNVCRGADCWFCNTLQTRPKCLIGKRGPRFSCEQCP